MRMMKRLLLLTFIVSLMACNTFEGIGKDIRAVGGTIEKTASKNKK